MGLTNRICHKEVGNATLLRGLCNHNAVTTNDSYPQPRMNERMDSISDSKIFPTPLTNSGCWYVEVHKNEREQKAPTTHHGLYQFIRVIFALRSVPATFQGNMDVIPSTVKWHNDLVYLEDFVIL